MINNNAIHFTAAMTLGEPEEVSIWGGEKLGKTEENGVICKRRGVRQGWGVSGGR